MASNVQMARRPFVNSGFEFVNKNALNTDGFIFKLEYAEKIRGLFGSSIIGYWPLWELAGTAAQDFSGGARNGAHTAVTLGQAGIGDGRSAGSFDGSTSFTNVYSTALNTAFNSQEMTLSLWLKMSSVTVWTDATLRFLFRFRADANNQVYIQRTATDNQESE